MTLIEVMVAMGLLAVAGVALMKTSSAQLRHLDHLEKKQLAAWVAENQLILAALPQAERSQEVMMAGERWVWQITEQPTTQTGVSLREVQVWHRRAQGMPLIQLQTWVMP